MLGFSCLSIITCSTVSVANNASTSVPNILVFGDSLSAAYGIPQQQGWAVLLQNKLNEQQYNYQVVNASVSGETTSGGLSRLTAKLIEAKPAIVILALGANDGLRGLPIQNMKTNLDMMIKSSKESGAKVLLLGMKIPPNYGPKYTNDFSGTYTQLSKTYQISLVPFMLENVAAKPNLIQDDGLHPNALGQPIILDNLWNTLKPLLKK
ncbi:MAG: arylesterase [Bacteroidia bacterium]|nr:arylesterase [Methylotenera sp.]